MTPTRKQKKTWRRRVNRARWSRNDGRFVMRDPVICVGAFMREEVQRHIVAPWLRGEK